MSCGHYCLAFLVDRSTGKSFEDFLNQFSKHDYVLNDHRVAQRVKVMIQNDVKWHQLRYLEYQQDNKRDFVTDLAMKKQ